MKEGEGEWKDGSLRQEVNGRKFKQGREEGREEGRKEGRKEDYHEGE